MHFIPSTYGCASGEWAAAVQAALPMHRIRRALFTAVLPARLPFPLAPHNLTLLSRLHFALTFLGCASAFLQPSGKRTPAC